MKPSERDLEMAEALADLVPDYPNAKLYRILRDAIAEALAAERASLPESVEQALILNVPEDERDQALAELKAWQAGK